MPTVTEQRRAHTRTSVRVERVPGSRVRVHLDAASDEGFPTIRPMLTGSDAVSARVSLVPEGALLLDGDAVALHIVVGADAALTLSEPAGTVAYDMRGGEASWNVSIELAAGASLIWHGEPFVAAAGSRTVWNTQVVLDPDATMLLRETLVLGRHGEAPGHIRHHVQVQRPDAAAVFADCLDIGPRTSRLLLGGRRVVGSTLAFGARADARGTRYELQSGGVLVRALGHEAHQLH